MTKKNPFEVYTSVDTSKKNKPLEWEESAPDSGSRVEGFFDDDRTAPFAAVWLWGLLAVCFLIIFSKIFFLQIVKGQNFRMLSEENRIREQTVLAPRGIIKDRNGEILVQNTASFNLVAVPFDLPKEGLDEEVLSLAHDLNMDASDIQDQLKNIQRNSFEPVLVKQDLSLEQSILFETKTSQYVGFSISKIPIRQYISPAEFSHVLGYTGVVSKSELGSVDKTRYDNNDYIGKLGIEAQYEQYLHGENGQNQIEVDATGKLLNVLGEDRPKPGMEVVLNLDKGLQTKLYQSFKSGTRGAAVAMNPKTGEVLALVSVPGFDNNLFAHGIKQRDYESLLEDKNLPLFNRSISGTYPPGSTVKPMVATAALEEGIVNENTVINDRGALVVPNQFNPSISYRFIGWKPGGLGPVTVRDAIALSSDIYFYTVTGGYPNSPVEKGLGAEKLAAYYRKFGVGSFSGIDIQGEKSGIVADPSWKASYFKDDAILSQWYLGDTYHVGIGQGDMLVTPLQVCLWTATIANGGVGYKPYILNKVIGPDGKTVREARPEVLVSNIASEKNIKIVQEGMRQTVTSGTGRQLNTLSVSSAGKTGTSQFDGSDPKRTHAWFTVYAPYEDPQIVLTVLVEAGGEGNEAALPIAKEALKWWAENRFGK